MKHLTTLLILTAALSACKAEAPADPAAAEAPQWTAEVSELDATGDSGVEVKIPGAAEFAPWRGGQPIPPGSTVRTPATVRATIALPHSGKLTMNHSSVMELAEDRRLVLAQGQAVLEYPPIDGEKEDITVVLPTGEVVLHGTKVALVAGEKDSSVTVTQGLVEVRHGGEAFEGRAGQEIVLRQGAAPSVTQAPDLGRRLGWAELGDTERSESLPEVARGLGKLVGKTPGGESEHRLDLVKHRVHVKIQGNLAYTEITESFKNPVGQTLEGVYRFPLPADARISRLALKVGNKVMEGEFLETARAEAIWRDVIEQWRDPAMLKWKEGNTFELRIFPIEPHQTREVTIGYVQRLEPSVGGYTYTYPMPMDRAGLIPAERFEFEGELFGHDATMPLEVLGYPGRMEAGATDKDKAYAKIVYSEDNFIARGDLGVRFGRRDASGLRSYAYQDKGKDPYAVFVLRPDLPAQAEIKPRDFVIIVDRSLSRTGAALEVQRRLVPRMIREMDPLDRVAVVACNERCDAIASEFAPARLSTADTVESALLDVTAGGGTYPVEAVRVAADLFRRRGESTREAHVVYFTDGIASVGELRPGKLSDAVKRTLSPFNARMSIIDVGGNSDALVLNALASAGRGRVVALDPMLSMTGQALDVLSAHYREVLEHPKLALPPGIVADVALPSAIAAGDELVVAARFTGAVQGEVVLTGLMNGKEYTLRYPVNLQPSTERGNQFVPGEWAAQRITALELDAGDHKREIVNLSKTYGVLSRYTTLLALESREMMEEFGVRKRDRVQWSGDDEAGEADDDAAPDTARQPRRPKPSMTKKPAKKKTKSAPRLSLDSGRGMAAPMEEMAEMEPMPDRLSKGSGKKDMAFDEKKRERRAPPTPSKPMPDAVNLFGDGGSTFRPMGRPTPRHKHYRRRSKSLSISPAREADSGERAAMKRAKSSLSSDSTNRTKRMRLIRSQLGAELVTDALAETRDWLNTNPMDPEALVQMAQIQAFKGDLESFYSQLLSASDAAPRGRWLQERIASAARSRNDEAMACAFDVALESTAKTAPKQPADILACPMTTAIETWFGEPGPAMTPPLADGTKPNGKAVIRATSQGGDWDIMVLEPSGRPLWWGSARRNLRTANVVGSDRSELLVLPTLRDGRHSVRLVSRTGKAGDVINVEVSGTGGVKRSFTVTAPSSKSFEVAEFSWGY